MQLTNKLTKGFARFCRFYTNRNLKFKTKFIFLTILCVLFCDRFVLFILKGPEKEKEKAELIQFLFDYRYKATVKNKYEKILKNGVFFGIILKTKTYFVVETFLEKVEKNSFS